MSQNYNNSGNPVDMNAMLAESLSKSIDTMGNHQYKDGEPDTARLAGIVEMDKGFVEAINMFFASFGHLASKWLSPKVYEIALKNGERLNTKLGTNASQTTLQRTAAGITLGVNLSLFLGESASKLYHDMRDQHDARTEMNRTVRSAFDRPASAKGNTVIIAQRRRMAKEASVTNMNTVLMGVGPNILNLIGESTNLEALMSGEHRVQVYQRKYQELTDRFRGEIEATYKNAGRTPLSEKAMDVEISRRIDKEHSGGSLFGFAGGGLLLSKFFKAQANSSERRLKHQRQPFSAYEMIVGLHKQMSDNPGKGGRYALPERKGGELELGQYIATMLELHQREMLDFDKDSVEIRKALKEDLSEVSKAIAERLEKGDLEPMQLIRLVGEGLVVKNKGRAVISADEVNALIDQMATVKARAKQGDPKEYFATRAFTEQALKDDFKHLDGEERQFLAASIPDAVLRKIGFKDDEIKKVQQFRASEAYNMMLATVALGMEAEGDEKLHDGGLGQTQLKQVHKAAETIESKGEEGLAALKASGHAEGVEHAVTDYVVNQIPKNKVLLSTLMQAGKERMDKPREPKHEKTSHVEKHRPEGPAGHGRHAEGYNDNESFADGVGAAGHGHASGRH